MGLFSNTPPKMKVQFVPQGKWIEHYEVLEKTIVGWLPLMTWHPMSGDRPMMFDTQQLAEKYIKDVNQIVIDKKEAFKNAVDFESYKILCLPKNKDWVAHYEVWEKTFFMWSPIMTSHPLSGDKPHMFDSLEQAQQYIQVQILKQEPSNEQTVKKSKPANRVARF